MIVVNLKDIIALGLLLISIIVIFALYLYDRISYRIKKALRSIKRKKEEHE